MASGNLRKKKYIVIAGLVITGFLFGNVALAEKMKISAQDAEKIKTTLGITQTFLNISKLILNDNDLATILSKAIDVGKTGTDVTYGLLVLSAINEMELMDLVLSQKYKTEAVEYFEQIIKEKTNLLSYWKGIGFDMPKVASGYITGPMGALTLNSFAITDKAIAIFGEFNILKKMNLYDGLWWYFNLRKYDNEPHNVAWEEAREVIGFGVVSNPLRFGKKDLDKDYIQLEQQFSALWDNWGPYATPWGIDKKYKEQLASELRDTLVAVLETQNLTGEKKEQKEPSWLAKQIEEIKNLVAVLLTKVNVFKAGSIVELSEPEPTEEFTENGPLLELEPEHGPITSEEPKGLSENSSRTTEEILPSVPAPALESESESELTPIIEPAPEPEPTPEPAPTSEPAPETALAPAPALCQRTSANPARFRVLINEIAWMGTTNSANDEWIELKNIWGLPVNLSGWQLLDKDKQIKIIFSEKDTIPADGFYLLERTSDDTLPGAAADFIYTGALNNTDEALYFFDSNCQLEDEVLANPNWPAGDNIEKRSMERLDPLNWYTSNSAGTAKAQNSPPPASSSSPTPTPEPEPTPQSTQPLLTVVMNEIAWMGTSANSADEWIELYNNTASAVDLTGWRLVSSDGSPDITFPTSTIAANSFYLLERTDDTTVNDIAADLIYTGALSNTGEKLELRNANNTLIDMVDSSGGWFSGEASPNYVSMERINPSLSGLNPDSWASNNRVPWEGWQGRDADGNRINGTPKSKNSVSKNSTAVSNGGFSIDNDFILRILGSPYLVEGSINVLSGAKLTIEPGVTIKFKHSNAWKSELKVQGELSAIGTQAQKITFTSSSTQPAAGDWEWLYFENSSSTLRNAIVQYAGKKEGNPPENPYFTRGAVYINGGTVTIENSLIEQSKTLGVWLKNSTSSLINSAEFLNIQGDWEKPAAVFIENSSPIVKNSTFQNNNTGIWIESSASSTIENNNFENNQTPIKTNTLLADFSGNIVQNNALNGILVSGLGFSETAAQINWQKAGLPYVLESNAIIASNQTLNIRPGTIIKLKSGVRFYVDGTLRAEGTGNEKIVFTSFNDDEHGGDTNNNGSAGVGPYAGYWNFIYFSALSNNSILDDVVIRYGGWYSAPFKRGAVKIDSASVAISNSLFDNNLVAGLELENSTSTVANTTFKNHRAQYGYGAENSMGIWVKNDSGDCPDLSTITFGQREDANSVNIWPTNCNPE